MEYLRVTNWDRFQHYKKDRPPWIKLYRDILSNYEFYRLDAVEKWSVVGLWLLAAETGNHIPNDPGWLQERLGLPTPANIAMLQARGFVEVREVSRDTLDVAYRDPRDTLVSDRDRDRDRDRGSVAKATAPVEAPTTVENPSTEAEHPTPPDSAVEGRRAVPADELRRLEGEAAKVVRSTWWVRGQPPPAPWSMGNELTIYRQLCKHFDPEELLGAITVAPQELQFGNRGATLKLFRSQEQGWPLINRCIGAWQKRQASGKRKGLEGAGEVLARIVNTGGAG